MRKTAAQKALDQVEAEMALLTQVRLRLMAALGDEPSERPKRGRPKQKSRPNGAEHAE